MEFHEGVALAVSDLSLNFRKILYVFRYSYLGNVILDSIQSRIPYASELNRRVDYYPYFFKTASFETQNVQPHD